MPIHFLDKGPICVWVLLKWKGYGLKPADQSNGLYKNSSLIFKFEGLLVEAFGALLQTLDLVRN